jgi:DNA repair protein RadD
VSLVLRDYQADVVNRARARMAAARRGIIQGETGSGKTLVGAELCRLTAAKGRRAMVLADRRRLVQQFGTTLDGMGVRFGVIMAGATGGTREPIVLASRDTFASWINNDREYGTPDLVIVDECHKSMGALYQAILARFPSAFVVGLTATPARDDGKSLGEFYQWIECTVPASQLITEGWLVKPEVYAPLELAKRRKAGDAAKGLAGDPVAHWRAHADGLPTIAFASNRTEAADLCERFRGAGIPSECIDGTMSDDPGWDGKSDRDRVYARLADGSTQVLCSVGLLIEGVDIPQASATIWWCACGSVVKWRQGNGRIMRPHPGKSRAVVLDHSGAAGVHGLPGDDVDWSLDMGSTVASRREKAIEEGRQAATVLCRACGFAYSGKPACPSCGKAAPRIERQRTMAEQYTAATDAILERFDPSEVADLLKEKRQRMWHRAIYTAISRNATAGMAAQVFQRACRLPPWEAGVSPLPESRAGWRDKAADVFPGFVRAHA